jgi:gamma-glutamyltranspeptidase/glutathione hydrolase
MVVGTSGPPAIRAAADALRQGGTAVDAVLIAALTQVALAAGCWVSYAGMLSLVNYDARTGAVHSLNAAFDTVRGERDPLSIPGDGRPSGRTVLVPGFMAGVQAAHDRFGGLPRARLFEPAIDVAEAGFRVGPALHHLLRYRRRVVTRLPAGREVFLTERGRLYRQGDLFRQPRLAETLRRVAVHGADYLYRGAWARRLVDAVGRQGGRLALRDLEAYDPIWTRPLRARYGGYDVSAPGLPALGGVHTVEALHLLDRSGLRRRGHYAASPEALYWLIHITRAAWLGPGLPAERRLQEETSRRLWQEIERRGGLTYASRVRIRQRLQHSDAVVAADGQGNVAALCHSINTVAWGATGIFVDGISVPDAAGFQQREIALAGPGTRLPDVMNPLLVTERDRPVLATACIGSSLHEVAVQALVSSLDFGMAPHEAAGAPFFTLPLPTPADALLGWRNPRLAPLGRSLHWLLVSAAAAVGWPRAVVNPAQGIERDSFSTALVDAVRAMGQELEPVGADGPLGFWAGIRIAAGGGPRLRGAVTARGPLSDAAVAGG